MRKRKKVQEKWIFFTFLLIWFAKKMRKINIFSPQSFFYEKYKEMRKSENIFLVNKKKNFPFKRPLSFTFFPSKHTFKQEKKKVKRLGLCPSISDQTQVAIVLHFAKTATVQVFIGKRERGDKKPGTRRTNTAFIESIRSIYA